MSPNLMFYHRSTGQGAYYSIDPDGRLTPRGEWNTFAKSWTRIVQVQAGFDATAKRKIGDLLFYDASAGRGDFYRFGGDEAGTPEFLARRSDFAKTWTHIVAVPFESHTNLLFYDAAAGRASVYRYIDRGRMAHLKTLSSLPKSWTHLVPGNFGGAYGGLLVYDAVAGQGGVYRMNGDDGDLKLVKNHTGLAKTWTEVVSLPFGFRTDLLFYAAGVGAAEVYRVDAQGNLEQINRYLNFSKTWSRIVPVMPFEAHWPQALLYFYDPVGKSEAYRVDGLGRLELGEYRTDLGKNWTQIVPVYEQLPPPVHHIRVRAIVTGNDDSPTFTAGFKKADIAGLVEKVNAVYKEAGVHLDFDPNVDVEEVRSTLLNRDFGLDANGEQTLYPIDKGSGPVLPLTPKPNEPPLFPEGRARQDLGWRYRGRLVIFFRDHLGTDSKGRARSIAYGYATDRQEFVAMPKDPGADVLLAHELGHYLHLPHTHVGSLKIAQIRVAIKNWVEGQPEAKTALAQGTPIPQHVVDRGLEALDGDASFSVGALGGATRTIVDTPGDAGPNAFSEAGANPCQGDPLPVEVTFSAQLPSGQNQSNTYQYDPDPRNVMSYFGCGSAVRFSAGQVQLIRDALRFHNRKHLTAAN